MPEKGLLYTLCRQKELTAGGFRDIAEYAGETASVRFSHRL